MKYRALLMTLLIVGFPGLLFLPALLNTLFPPYYGDLTVSKGEVGPLATSTFCPPATPEPLWVDPVISPTGILTQTIVIYIGNGEWAGVTLETGVYTQTGNFDAYSNPAAIQIDMLPNQAHHLTASGRVKQVVRFGDCKYGGYTLSTHLDRLGNPLTILQLSNQIYFPLVHNP